MRKVLLPALLGLAAVCLLLGLVPFGCEDNPVGPTEEEPKDYPVYFWDGTSELEYFAYHPLTGELEKFSIPYNAWAGGIHVSADGKLLYAATSDCIGVIALDSLHVISELPYEALCGIAVAPDNSMIAHYHGGLHILSTEDYSILYEDSSSGMCDCTFSANSKRLYCTLGQTQSKVGVLDIENDFAVTVKEFSAEATVPEVRVSPDETRWFLYRIRPNGYGIFDVYDVPADSIIFRKDLSYGHGHLAVSPNGRYAFLTESGDFLWGGGSRNLTVYDIENNRIRMLASTVGIGDGINPNDMALCKMAVTPDSKWLIAAKAFSGSSFIRFNIETLEIDDYVDMDTNRVVSPTCQNSK
jgi:DNA-binding beta-propeller fold protein YncE